MESDLVELYEQFDGYWARLETDVGKMSGGLSEGTTGAFGVPRPTFAEFQTMWEGIQGDPALVQRWMRRMTPTGYDDETRAIEAELSRYREARETNSRKAA